MKKLLSVILIVLLASNAAWATATVFDAVDDKVAVTQFTGINGAARTVGCWVNRQGHGEDATAAFFDKFSNGTGGVQIVDRGSAAATYRLTSEYDTTDGVWSFNRPTDSVWHHIAIGYNHAATTVDPVAWVDGVSVSVTENTTPVGTAVLGAALNMAIGNDHAGTDDTINAYLASCFWFDRVLTTAEVLQIMHFGPPSLIYGLICYWPMGTWGGSNIAGSGGTSCAGTESGTPARNEGGPPSSAPQGGFAWQ